MVGGQLLGPPVPRYMNSTLQERWRSTVISMPTPGPGWPRRGVGLVGTAVGALAGQQSGVEGPGEPVVEIVPRACTEGHNKMAIVISAVADAASCGELQTHITEPLLEGQAAMAASTTARTRVDSIRYLFCVHLRIEKG